MTLIDRLNARVTIDLPTRREVGATCLIAFLAHGWWDERGRYVDMLQVATTRATEMVACQASYERRVGQLEAETEAFLAAYTVTLAVDHTHDEEEEQADG